MAGCRFIILLPLLALCACASSGGVYHKVEGGETLSKISRTYGVSELYLARINGISDPSRLQSGDLVFIPGAHSVRDTSPETRKAAPPPATAKTQATKTSKAEPAAKSKAPAGKGTPARKSKANKTATPTATAAAAKSATAAAATSAAAAAASKPPAAAPAVVAGRFLWPLHGETLRRFGGKNGTTSKGMELAAAANTPIVAAAAGRVIYSGDGIRSYGNLIILKHDESFFTVYGYNERNLVAAGSFVSKGEKIALVGTPPEGGRPRLYFELRYGKEAVDPTIYLP